ncbi:anti-sigma-I factor RsgI2-like [Manihot esculenta]|uniref:anti-sigma-I factor RsgI2-like n=1 Tax=Manihot esculenta TaxID=3983 RepID=UPI001CC5A7B8|nr:anti-sigma-I factor RsgI2-like [Manihot esculenta]
MVRINMKATGGPFMWKKLGLPKPIPSDSDDETWDTTPPATTSTDTPPATETATGRTDSPAVQTYHGQKWPRTQSPPPPPRSEPEPETTIATHPAGHEEGDATTDVPSNLPTDAPTSTPSDFTSNVPSAMPNDVPTDAPTDLPSKGALDDNRTLNALVLIEPLLKMAHNDFSPNLPPEVDVLSLVTVIAATVGLL